MTKIPILAMALLAPSLFAADALDDALNRLEQASRPVPPADDSATITSPAPTQAPAPLPHLARELPAPAPAPVTPPAPRPAAPELPAPKVETPTDAAQVVWPLDPRQRISDEQAAKEGYEMTTLGVQRIFTAAAYPPNAPADAKPIWSNRLPFTVPVLYQTRTLRLAPEQVAKAREVLRRLQALKTKADEVKTESEKLLGEWNAIVAASTPTDCLSADSPTLTSNQSASPLNREDRDGFRAGQGVTFTIGNNDTKKIK